MSSVYRVRWRVLRQRLGDTLAHARQRQDDECARLAALGLALLDRHAVDAKGRCQSCRNAGDGCIDGSDGAWCYR